MSPSSARIRAAWPLLLLLAGLACILLALREATRSMRSNQAIADQALRGYGSFAAWSFEEHFSEAVRVATQEVLGGVNMFHQSPPIPSAGDPGHALAWDAACNCHRARFGPLPIAFLGFKLGSDTLGVAYNQAPAGSAGWLVDMAMPMPPITSGPASHGCSSCGKKRRTTTYRSRENSA